MKNRAMFGLGEPEPVGKKTLFQTPSTKTESGTRELNNGVEESANKESFKTSKRIRTTIELTDNALVVIQDIQNHHRLRTGKVLPLWKIVSQAVEFFGKSKMGEKT